MVFFCVQNTGNISVSDGVNQTCTASAYNALEQKGVQRFLHINICV